jgi:hypothetical protein
VVDRLLESKDRRLGIVVAALSLVSLGAFVGQVYGVFDMTFAMAFFALPATLAIIGLGRWSAGGDYALFHKRLLLGLLFGVAATASYDLVRLILQETLPLNFNAFAIHARFGELIIDRPHTTTIAKVVGWSYHISNGLTFALCFTLVAGRVRWWWGVLYALVLQSLMVLTYPTAFGVSRGSEAFLIVSFTGHATYGAVLGLLNRRFNLNEEDWRGDARSAQGNGLR